jgi:ADP-ribose pyrophosphatase
MPQKSGWNRRNYKYLFESKWFNLRQDEITLPNGQDITYTFVEHPGYSMVVPLLSNGLVILERIYRYAIGKTLLECPSGSLDGNNPEECAQRELLEETGYESSRLDKLGSFYGSNSISNEHFHLFLATDLKDTGRFHREPTEEIELAFLPLNEVASMALAGEIEDAPSALAIILANQKLKIT